MRDTVSRAHDAPQGGMTIHVRYPDGPPPGITLYSGGGSAKKEGYPPYPSFMTSEGMSRGAVPGLYFTGNLLKKRADTGYKKRREEPEQRRIFEEDPGNFSRPVHVPVLHDLPDDFGSVHGKEQPVDGS